MTSPAGQKSEDASQPMDLEQIEDHATCESKSGDCVGQKSVPSSVLDEELADVQTSIQNIEVLQAGQGTAAEAATPKSEDTLPSIRGGENRTCIDQDHDYKAILEDENADVQPANPGRRRKVPLAEQGAAFQAALQQSKEAAPAPSIKGGKGTEKKWTKAMRHQAAAAVAENPRLAALKKQKEKEKKARKKEKKRQQMCEAEGGLNG